MRKPVVKGDNALKTSQVIGVVRFQTEVVFALLAASVLEACGIQFAAVLNSSRGFVAVTIRTQCRVFLAWAGAMASIQHTHEWLFTS